MDKSVTRPTPFTTLLIDALYFHAARQAFKSAKESTAGVDETKVEFEKLRHQEKTILKKYSGDTIQAYDELEPIYIAMEQVEYMVGESYGPLLQALAATHIFCACSLEAHINVLSEDLLSKTQKEHFDKLSLEGKWLFLPCILGFKGFDPGTEPYQSFDRLVSIRNRLVHYKPKRELWKSPGVPEFIIKLGLTCEEAERSLKCTTQMIKTLAKKLHVQAPYWLRDSIDVTNYFNFEIH